MAIFIAVFCMVGVLFLGPRTAFEEPEFAPGPQLSSDPESYLLSVEAEVEDLRPGAGKEIVWADPETRRRTPLSLVYLHGFSATKEEVRPLPDRVAGALGANLFFTRLAGHGRDGAAMAEATVEAWLADTAEAVAVGEALGEKVVLVATSTGATLAALAAREPSLNRRIAGVVLISPNFHVRAAGASLLTLPYAESVIPAVMGRERGWEPRSDGHARWWTTSYPTAALFPMAAVVKAARRLDYAEATAPALFVFDPRDAVVDHEATRAIAARWAGPVEIEAVTVGPDQDANRHVIAGRILSPAMTAPLADRIADWAGANL